MHLIVIGKMLITVIFALQNIVPGIYLKAVKDLGLYGIQWLEKLIDLK